MKFKASMAGLKLFTEELFNYFYSNKQRDSAPGSLLCKMKNSIFYTQQRVNRFDFSAYTKKSHLNRVNE